MNVSVIPVHPDPQSFNAAIAKQCADTLAANGHTVFRHDFCFEWMR